MRPSQGSTPLLCTSSRLQVKNTNIAIPRQNSKRRKVHCHSPTAIGYRIGRGGRPKISGPWKIDALPFFSSARGASRGDGRADAVPQKRDFGGDEGPACALTAQGGRRCHARRRQGDRRRHQQPSLTVSPACRSQRFGGRYCGGGGQD